MWSGTRASRSGDWRCGTFMHELWVESIAAIEAPMYDQNWDCEVRFHEWLN